MVAAFKAATIVPAGGGDADDAGKNCPVPAGAANLDVALLIIECWWDTTTDPVVGWPSGFSEIGRVESSTDGFLRLIVGLKELSGADSGTYNYTLNQTYWNQAQCQLWSGIDLTTNLDVAIATATTANNSTMPSLSLTTVTDGCGMVHIVSNENSASGTAPTGYTERTEANYLRTNTKVAGSAGAETPSGGSISASTPKVGMLIALRPAGGGGTAVTPATETDTGQAVGRTQQVAAGPAAETDVAQTVGRTRQTATAPATETDTAVAAGRTRASATTPATETDVAVPVDSSGGTPAGPATETDTGQPVGRTRTSTAGAATETDTGVAVARTRDSAPGTATETDVAQQVDRTRITPTTPATETDVALDVTNPSVPILDLLLEARTEPGPWRVAVEPDPYTGDTESDRWRTEVVA